MSTESGLHALSPQRASQTRDTTVAASVAGVMSLASRLRVTRDTDQLLLFYDPLLYPFPSSLTHGGPWDGVDVGRGRLEGTSVCVGGGGREGERRGGGKKSVSARPSTGLFLSSIVRLSDLVLVHLLGCVCTPALSTPLQGGRGGGGKREGGGQRDTE